MFAAEALWNWGAPSPKDCSAPWEDNPPSPQSTSRVPCHPGLSRAFGECEIPTEDSSVLGTEVREHARGGPPIPVHQSLQVAEEAPAPTPSRLVVKAARGWWPPESTLSLLCRLGVPCLESLMESGHTALGLTAPQDLGADEVRFRVWPPAPAAVVPHSFRADAHATLHGHAAEHGAHSAEVTSPGAWGPLGLGVRAAWSSWTSSRSA